MSIPWLQIGQSLIYGLAVYVIYFILMLLGAAVGRAVPAVGKTMDTFNPKVESLIVNLLFVAVFLVSAYYLVLPEME
ncbi:hypothetical protein FHS18_003658 [Paenibacillus phyllosphaerae]|uniref:Uncharacterized protein n=1 Tax=Paenibacillus phyllosphaerae TaxID=274593 RepID=A0A7W5AZE7_9BACL|nr:hypothetical protein [Paenibacillus phyllosphaerae]MBB3111590.1 hypothetical protein [Paenibacillus phyllosphaerae]